MQNWDKKNTIFCDIDGTIFKYRKFETYKTTEAEPIQSTIDYLKQQLRHLLKSNFQQGGIQ